MQYEKQQNPNQSGRYWVFLNTPVTDNNINEATRLGLYDDQCVRDYGLSHFTRANFDAETQQWEFHGTGAVLKLFTTNDIIGWTKFVR